MSSNSFLKGVTVGIMVGAAIGFAVTPKSKTCKKMTGRFLRTAGDIIENIGGILS